MTSCQRKVSGSVSLPSQGFFSPFLHSTSALSVAVLYLALDRGRPGFRQGSSCPALLRHRIMESVRFRLRGSHALRPAFPCRSAARRFYPNSTGHPHAALQPRQRRFGLLPFRSPLLRESLLISFPGLLRWFTSPSLTSGSYLCSLHGSGRLRPGVTPFGYPRLSGYVPLPAAFRSLSRPSSPYGSKASTLRFLSLGHIASPAIILKKTPAQPLSGGKARFPSPFPLLSKNRHLYEDLISIQTLWDR